MASCSSHSLSFVFVVMPKSSEPLTRSSARKTKPTEKLQVKLKRPSRLCRRCPGNPCLSECEHSARKQRNAPQPVITPPEETPHPLLNTSKVSFGMVIMKFTLSYHLSQESRLEGVQEEQNTGPSGAFTPVRSLPNFGHYHMRLINF
jgi:hypothetical protein